MSAADPQARLDEATRHLDGALAALDEIGTAPIAAAYIVHAIEVLRDEVAANASLRNGARETQALDRT